MNAKQLRKIMKPVQKQAKIILESYIENENTVTISYRFKGQQTSHLKIDSSIWNTMQFEKEEDAIYITNISTLKVVTNENGWKRLVVDIEEDNDE